MNEKSTYQPLALKYRPQLFKDVIGQDLSMRVLIGMLRANRIGVGYLFGGQRGCGKTSVARLFSKALNCPNKTRNSVEPCNTCKVCKDITEGRSTDVQEYDSASAGSVATIRKLRDDSIYRTMGGGYRVWILDEAHAISREGFNALLKILEEPPPRVLFILCTTEIHLVPDTIISRCFQIPFRAVTVEDVKSRLLHIAEQEGLNVTEELVGIIAERGGGSVRDSLTLMDQLIAVYGRDLSSDEVKSVVGIQLVTTVGKMLVNALSDSPREALLKFRSVWATLPDSREFIRAVAEWFRNISYVRSRLPEYVDPTNLVVAKELSSLLKDKEIAELLNSVSLLEKALAQTRLSPQILIEMWLLSILPPNRMRKVVDEFAVEEFWNSVL